MKDIIEGLGGELIVFDDKRNYPSKEEFFVLKYEFREGIESYLSTAGFEFKTLKDLIAFNERNKDLVQKHFDQSIFILSDSTKGLVSEYNR